MSRFRYTTGELVLLGDIVCNPAHPGEERVAMMLAPGSTVAAHFLCGSTGGIFLEPSREIVHIEDADWFEWVLVRREPATME